MAPVGGITNSHWPGVSLTQNGRSYYRTDAFLYYLINGKVDLRVSGWINPVLKAGDTEIALETDDWQVINKLYVTTLDFSDLGLRNGLTTPFALIEPNSMTGNLSFRGKFQKNKVYALVIPKLVNWTGTDAQGQPADGFINILNTTSQAQAGRVQFHVPQDFSDYKLYSSVSAFHKAIEPYSKLVTAPVVQWNAQHPAPVLILELSGHFGANAFTVVSPAAVTSSPVKRP